MHMRLIIFARSLAGPESLVSVAACATSLTPADSQGCGAFGIGEGCNQSTMEVGVCGYVDDQRRNFSLRLIFTCCACYINVSAILKILWKVR